MLNHVRICQEELSSRACSYSQVEGLDHRHGASSGLMQGVHSPPRNAAGRAGDRGARCMHSRAPAQGQACSQQGAGQRRARVSSAPPGTGDPKQRLPDRCMEHSDACSHARDPSWLPGSISSREESTHRAHPVVSVLAAFCIRQDKPHLTKQSLPA